MRKFKTAEENRTNYIYYTADGMEMNLQPGREGVDETWITILHDMDDDEFDAGRRENYHIPVRYMGYKDGEGEDAYDRNTYLGDEDADPLEQILAAVKGQEHCEKLERLKAGLAELTDLQKSTVYKKFWLKKTNVQIAAEEGVSEAAVRKRLKKICAALGKKI